MKNKKKYEALEKLEKSLKRKELYKFLLCSEKEYRLSGYQDPVFPRNNDYASLVYALNDYGLTHPEFISLLQNTIIKCLKEAKAGTVYNIVNIVRYQLIFQRKYENSIQFLTTDIYDNLRIAFIQNIETLKELKIYEGMLYENGLADAIKEWCESIYHEIGYKIL